MLYSKNSRGYTLIELVVVIAIVAVLAAFASVNFRPMLLSFRLSTTANMVRDLLVTARTRAISNPRVHCGVYFNLPAAPTPDSVLCFYDSGSAGNNNLYDKGHDGVYLPSRGLPNGILFSIPSSGGLTNNAVVFRGDGSAKFGGTIVVQTATGKVDSINVLPSTGRVKVIRK